MNISAQFRWDFTKNEIVGRAAVPSGASTGQYEAVELRDAGEDYCGKGVLIAVSNVNDIIAKELVGKSVFDQRIIDNTMIDLVISTISLAWSNPIALLI